MSSGDPITPLTPAIFHIMVALSRGATHGYGIMQEVKRMTGGRMTLGPGTLYRSAQRLLKGGYIRELEGPSEDERRRPYELTAAGRKVAAAEAARLQALLLAVGDRGLLSQGETEAVDAPQAPVFEEPIGLTPRLCVNNAESAIDFYKNVFDAHEVYRSVQPGGTEILHAELMLGQSRLQVHDEAARGSLNPSPTSLGGTPFILCLWVEDVDAVFTTAIAMGGSLVSPVGERLWGDRYGIVADPFGFHWGLASRTEDTSPTEINRRAERAFS